MKKILFMAFLCLSCFAGRAQTTMTPVSWTAYGLTFDAPKGIQVEEDSEETFLLNDSKFYINIESLDSDGLTKDELEGMLKEYAVDDGVEETSAIKRLELAQFHVAYITGVIGEDRCISAILMTNDAGSGFHLTILYAKGKDADAEKILKSFQMEE